MNSPRQWRAAYHSAVRPSVSQLYSGFCSSSRRLAWAAPSSSASIRWVLPRQSVGSSPRPSQAIAGRHPHVRPTGQDGSHRALGIGERGFAPVPGKLFNRIAIAQAAASISAVCPPGSAGRLRAVAISAGITRGAGCVGRIHKAGSYPVHPAPAPGQRPVAPAISSTLAWSCKAPALPAAGRITAGKPCVLQVIGNQAATHCQSAPAGQVRKVRPGLAAQQLLRRLILAQRRTSSGVWLPLFCLGSALLGQQHLQHCGRLLNYSQVQQAVTGRVIAAASAPTGQQEFNGGDAPCLTASASASHQSGQPG